MPADRTLLERVAISLFPLADEVAHLGTGGFACTFRIREGDRQTALKIIDPGLSERERVDRELNALQRVTNDGVVQFLAHGVHKFEGVDYCWIRMEFIEGRSLGAELGAGVVFTPLEALDLISRLTDAAASIWAQGTAHRDLSPNNIILDADGRPVIVDLGLARHVDDESYTALPTPGTPGWMSPEQVGSSPVHGDWRSDQFVIGALAYRLLTNVQPFYALSLIDRWRAPAVQTPQPIRAIDPEIPSAVADVVERMLHKQPHRRYLKVSELLTDLTLAISSMQSASTIETSPQRFLLNIGQVKNYAENGFLSALRPHGVVIDIRAGSRVREFVDATHDVGAEAIVDPVTHYVRSPLAVRPAGFRKLPYGSAPVLTGFSDETSRREFCTNVLDSVTADEPDAIVSPYFYAAENEQSWLTESVACAGLTEALLTQRGQVTSMWLGVAVHSSWLANERQRDLLLTALTARQWRGVHLLLSTTQAPFGPLGDVDTLRGLRDLIAVLREAGTPVIVGRRASSGLLLLALGAEGWSTGVSGNLMNMTPHPEDETSGGRSLDRIYIPGLVNLVSIEAYLLMRARRPEYVELGTPQAAALLDGNPSLDDLSTEERILLLQHNLIAQSRQVSELATLPAGQRIARLRTWVDVATERYRELPPTRLPSEGPAFLEGWAEVLA